MNPKPVCRTLRPWLKANLGPYALAVLTGTDARALDAAVHVIELYSTSQEGRVLVAFEVLVMAAQPCSRELFYHAIAHVMNWSDREKIWAAAGLPAFVPVRCKFE